MYSFVWDEFCDYYVELSKAFVYSDNKDVKAHAVAVMKDVYLNILKLLHPIIPFITEDIYSNFEEGFIMNSTYAKSLGRFEKEAAEVEKIINLIQKIRDVRLKNEIAPNKRISLAVSNKNSKENIAIISTKLFKLVG